MNIIDAIKKAISEKAYVYADFGWREDGIALSPGYIDAEYLLLDGPCNCGQNQLRKALEELESDK